MDLKDDNKFMKVMSVAEGSKVLTEEEIGFAVSLIKKFRSEVDAKVRQLHTLQGEINQLRNNEIIITNLIENIISAAKRNADRQRAMDEIKASDQI